MTDWILAKASDGDLQGGIRADQVVAWEVTKWPPEDSDDEYVEVGFWLQGDYRMVEPGQAPMHLNLTLEEYDATVALLRYGRDRRISDDVPKSTRVRRPRDKKAQEVETSEEDSSEGDDKEE